MPPPTIIAHKSTFLATQTLHLSQRLTPSAAWRTANERAEDGQGVSARAVDDAIYRLNHALTQHARRVYAPQATRHVAEQIERLFHDAAERALRDHDPDESDDNETRGAGGGRGQGSMSGEDTRRLRIGADFATDEAIASLPPTWDIHRPRETDDHPVEARRYAELAGSLTALSTQRQEARDRVERLRRMAAQLAPFQDPSTSDGNNTEHNEGAQSTAQTSVQQNLVTRNGELEHELERMRLLLARVAGRVARLPDRPEDGDHIKAAPDLDLLERDKVDRLLELL